MQSCKGSILTSTRLPGVIEMNNKDTKLQFRHYFIESVEERLKRSFNTLDPNDLAKELSRFYVKSIVGKLTPGLVPDCEEEIGDCMVDGPDDGGVDFIYASEGHVLIIQSKYCGQDKHECPEDLTHFCGVISRLYEAYTTNQKLNTKVRKALHNIDWQSDYFNLHFITLGKVSKAIRDRAAKGSIPVKALSDFEERTEITLCSEQDLDMRLREALAAGDILDETIDIQFAPNPQGIPWVRFQSRNGRDLYVGEVSGSQLGQLYSQHGYRLFAMNIRDYVGESSTNNCIVNTAMAEPDDFVFFNNGVSAVATQIQEDRDNHLLHCRRFSIINGAQTVRCLSRAQVQDHQPLRHVRVLLRIIGLSLGEDTDFVTDATRFNNTQNAIKSADFRSNDPVQKDLKCRFSNLNRHGKPYLYKNKRSREVVGNKILIGMEDFAKTIYAFRFGPDDMFGGTEYLFDVSPRGGYGKVFGEPGSRLADEHFKLLAGTYFLCDEIHFLWKERRENESAEGRNTPGLERRWVVYHAVGELLRLIYAGRQTELDADVRKLSKPNDWMDSPGNKVTFALGELFKLASVAINRAYSHAAKRNDFCHRNWFRDVNTLTDIKSELAIIPEYRFLKDLPSLRPPANR
jgi:hypothetical protein